jgi:endo-1,4-beta-D-glucanase Y
MWVWPAQPNKNNPFDMNSPTMRSTLIDRSAQSGVDILFTSLYTFAENSAGHLLYEGGIIADLVSHAHAKNIEVWASYGDASWADPTAKEWPGPLCNATVWPMARLAEMIAYNNANPTAKLDGVMLTVEPSTEHPETDAWLAGLLQLYNCAQKRLAPEGLKLAVSIRFYWNNPIEYPVGGPIKPMYQHVIDQPIDRIVVAGYRDFAGTSCPGNGLICLDEDEIAYADSKGKSGLILAGVETKNCVGLDCSGDIETFFEEGQNELDLQLGILTQHFGNSKSFGGVAIHHYLDAYLGDLPGWSTSNQVPPNSGPIIAKRPFPQHGVYSPGTILPSLWSQGDLDRDLTTLYQDWKGDYLKAAGTAADGTTLYRIALGHSEPNASITVSEGQGYGMIIMALIAGYDPDAQKIFDGLWKFSRAHPSNSDPNLMDWKIPPEDPAVRNSAFDGDADIAYAMLLADAQWGSSGAIHYIGEAKKVIAAILQSTIGPVSRLPTLGDWVDPNGTTYHQYTPRSSDFMPSHFRAFGKITADIGTWDAVLINSRDVVDAIQMNYSPLTGLIPDFMVPVNGASMPLQPASPYFLEGPHDGKFHYNASRVPWRLGLDVLLHGDAVTKSQLQKMTGWLRGSTSQDGSAIKAGYALDGTATGDYSTLSFIAPFGVAAMVDFNNQDWLNSIYSYIHTYVGRVADPASAPSWFSEEDYFEETVALLTLFPLSGNYWAP